MARTPEGQRLRSGAAWRNAVQSVKARDKHCGICGQPIDPRLRWPDPMSFSVDHIVPLHAIKKSGSTFAVQQSIANDVRNLRGTHLGCNSSRGAAQRHQERRQAPAPMAHTDHDW